jgi:hypothetical protein
LHKQFHLFASPWQSRKTVPKVTAYSIHHKETKEGCRGNRQGETIAKGLGAELSTKGADQVNF